MSIMDELLSLERAGNEVFEEFSRLKDKNAQKDAENISKIIKDLSENTKVTVRHLCSQEGTGLFAVTANGETHLIESVYKLTQVGAAWSAKTWYMCYVAQGRLLEYLSLVREHLAKYDFAQCIEFETNPNKVRHLYCGVIVRDLDCDMGKTADEDGEYRKYPIYTDAEYEYMKNHLEIYKRRFADTIKQWSAYTTPKRIQSGYLDWYKYYNEGYTELLEEAEKQEYGKA